MKVEFLYSRFYLFGDEAVPSYIEKCLPDSDFIYTEIDDKPFFVNNDVDFIYMGGMSERDRNRVIKSLLPYREKILDMIDKNVHILFTSTSLDAVGKKIESDDETVDGLSLFDFTTKERLMKRYSGFILGKSDDTQIAGFTARFTENFGLDEKYAFVTLDRGTGLNKQSKYEGIHKNNFYATSCIGPFAIINPEFTKKFLSSAAGKEVTLPFEDLQNECFKQRLTEMYDENRNI